MFESIADVLTFLVFHQQCHKMMQISNIVSNKEERLKYRSLTSGYRLPRQQPAQTEICTTVM